MDGPPGDVRLRLWLSLGMGMVLTLPLALWEHAPVGKIVVAAAGLLWLAALWTAPRPLSPQRLGALLAFLALGGVLSLLATAGDRAIFAVFALVVGLLEVRRRRRRKRTKVQAPDLGGTIEYGATNISATLVQEFKADWESELSAVLTDRAGRFELPCVSVGPIHYLVFSRPGTETLRLEVTIAPEAPPLSVRLRPRSG